MKEKTAGRGGKVREGEKETGTEEKIEKNLRKTEKERSPFRV